MSIELFIKDMQRGFLQVEFKPHKFFTRGESSSGIVAACPVGAAILGHEGHCTIFDVYDLWDMHEVTCPECGGKWRACIDCITHLVDGHDYKTDGIVDWLRSL